MTTLQRYILREIISPTLLGLLVFTFVFLVGQLFKLADDLLNSGIPARLAIELIALLIPSVLAITIPMALLVGILLGVGRLAADREILAIRASGISMLHLAKPIIAFAIFVSGAMIWTNAKLIPYLNLKSSDLQVQILFHALSAIPTGTAFPLPTEAQDNQRINVLIDAKDLDTGLMQGVTILTQIESEGSSPRNLADALTTATLLSDTESTTALAASPPAKPKRPKRRLTREERLAERRMKQERDWQERLSKPVQDILIMAEQGVFEPQIDERVVYIRLNNGSIQITDPDNPEAYDVIQFDTLTKGIVPTFSQIEKGYFQKAPREMTLTELRQQIAVRDRGGKFSTELLQRFSVPLACISFALIAFPLAVFVRPTGKAVAFAISFLLILFYYGMMEYGAAVNQSGKSFGPIAIFLPNVLTAAIGCFMLYRIVRR